MAARLLLRRAMVPAAASRPPTLRARFDAPPDHTGRTKPRVFPDGTLEPKVRPVLPLEIRHDAGEDVIILCSRLRGYFIHYATGAIGLLHSDLISYWVEDSLRQLYSDVLKQRRGVVAGPARQGEFGMDMDATLETFQKFGSAIMYELGTCCVRDENGITSMVVDERFLSAFSVLPYYPARLQPTGYTLWTVAFQCGAFAVIVERLKLMGLNHEYVVPDECKFRAAMRGASEEEVQRALQVKTAVEIDRSVLGQGKLLFFMLPESAWNKFEVFAEMCKAEYDMRGLELELVCEHASDRLKYAVCYTIRLLDRRPFESASEDDD